MDLKEHPTICVHDIVCLKARNNRVGMVLRVAWLADSDDEHWEFFDGLFDSEEEEVNFLRGNNRFLLF